MKRKSIAFGMLMISFLLFVSGCSVANVFGVGNKHMYHDVLADINATDSIAVGIATHDQREYILTGKKSPNFVGLSRGGYGNPFGVTTASGRNLADDMTDAISNSLLKRGYVAIPVIVSYELDHGEVLSKLKETAAKRLILLTLNEWKSDTYTNTALIYDVQLQVFDQSGKKLAGKHIQGRDDLKGSLISPPNHAKKVIPIAFREKLEELLNDPEIAKHLH